MQLFILALIVITYVEGNFCPTITFDNIDIGGVKVGRFYIDGTIGENVTELLQKNWKPVIFIEVLNASAVNDSFSAMCQFNVLGARCAPYPVEICQCVYNPTTDKVHFVVNGTADPDLYKAIIRAEWSNINTTIPTVYSNINYTVPGPPPVLPNPYAIVSGVVAAVLVIVVIAAAIFLLKRKGAPCKPKDHQYANTSVDALNGNDASGAPCKQKADQFVNTIMDTPYVTGEPEELPDSQAPESQHNEEIDIQTDVPDKPV